MAFNRIDQSFPRNRKTLRLAHRLKLKRDETSDRHQLMGHLVTFWLWSLDNATVDGRLTGVSDEEIAAASEWLGDPHRYVSALIDCGFLERDMDSTDIFIHDWAEYGGKLIAERMSATERMRRFRSGERAPHVTRTEREGDGLEKSRVEKSREEQRRVDPAAAAAARETSIETEPSELDEAVARLCRGWESATGTTVTRTVADGFEGWLEKLPEAALVKAIGETGAAGAKSWRYCAAILQRFEIEGWEDAPPGEAANPFRVSQERWEAMKRQAEERGVA